MTSSRLRRLASLLPSARATVISFARISAEGTRLIASTSVPGSSAFDSDKFRVMIKRSDSQRNWNGTRV